MSFRAAIVALIFVVAFIFVLNGCKKSNKENKTAVPTEELSGPEIKLDRLISEGIPYSIIDAMDNAPEDALIGVGFAKMASLSMSRTIAASRARAEIARQVNQITTEIVNYYSVKGKIDPSDETVFKEVITLSLSKANLSGVKIIEEEIDEDGTYWAVAMMSKENLIDQVSEVQEEAKSAVPSMASFDAGTLLNSSKMAAE